MAKAEDIRGQTVSIGRLTIQVPVTLPETDDDILGHEEQVALIKAECRPHKKIVDAGKEVVTLLQDDITAAMDARREDLKAPNLPGVDAPKKPRRKTGS